MPDYTLLTLIMSSFSPGLCTAARRFLARAFISRSVDPPRNHTTLMIQPVLLLIASDEHTHSALILSFNAQHKWSQYYKKLTIWMFRSFCLDCWLSAEQGWTNSAGNNPKPLFTFTAPAPQGTFHALCGVSCCEIYPQSCVSYVLCTPLLSGDTHTRYRTPSIPPGSDL